VKFNYTVVGTFIPKCTALGIHCWSKKKKKTGYKAIWSQSGRLSYLQLRIKL